MVYVITRGGNVIDNPAKLEQFLNGSCRSSGEEALIHGGGKMPRGSGTSSGIESKYVNGRRITDAETIDVVTMVYGGLVNKQIAMKLQARGCNAIGLTGADANIIPASKRPVKDRLWFCCILQRPM